MTDTTLVEGLPQSVDDLDITDAGGAIGSAGVQLDRLAERRVGTGLREFEPDDFDIDSDVTVFDSFAAAVQDNGIITGGVRALSDWEPVGQPDPNYDIQTHLESSPELLKSIQPFLDNPEDDAAGSFLSLLADSQNAKQTELIIHQLNEAQERIRRARANGMLPEIAGMIGGIGIDVMSTIAILAGTSGLGAPAVGTGAVIAGRSAAAARAIAAGRLGALGALEAGGERAVQSLTNPLISNVDIVEAAGYGTVTAGLLGFAFPTLFGNVRRLAEDITHPVPMSDELIDEARRVSGRAGPRAAGAAASPDDVSTPARGVLGGPAAASVLARRVIPRSLQENALRNPKRVITEIGALGHSEFIEQGLQGGRKFYDVMSRMVRVSTVNAEEMGGEVARKAAAQDIRNEFRAKRVLREIEAGNEYRDVVKRLYGVGAVGRYLRNNQIRQINKHFLSQDQYEAMADELSIARAQGHDDIDVIPEEIRRTLTAEQENTLRNSLEATASREDAFYQEFGQREVELGLIDEDELIPGYRPQRWNKEEIELDAVGFRNFLMETFRRRPKEEWVRENYRTTNDAGEVEDLLRADETWDDFVKREPELAEEIRDDWEGGVLNDLREQAADAVAERERVLKAVRGSQLTQSTQRMINRIDRANNLFAKLEKRLANETDPEVRGALAVRMGKVETRIADEQRKLAELRRAADNADTLDRALAKFGTRATRQELRKAQQKVLSASRKEARTAARKVASEEAEEIRRRILDGESPYQFIDEQFIQTSGRFQRRSINLGRNRFTPEARRFLLTNSHDARAAFDQSVSPQLALRDVFGGVERNEGEDLINAVRRQALEGYDLDLEKLPEGKARARKIAERRRAGRLFDKIFEEFTNADIARNQGLASDAVSVLNTATAAMALGAVSLAQMGDIAVQVMAGGRLGTGFRFMWRRRVNKHVKEIMADEGEIAVLLAGQSVLDASRFRAIADLDRTSFDIPGSRFRTVARVTNEVALIEGWANLMHVWNRAVRGGFGLDFARQIDKDFAKYARLPEHLKGFYAKVGISRQDAADMADLMGRHHKTFVNGHLRVPDSAAWAAERPDLLAKYKRALQAAGDEAMLDPQVADRPFLRSHPVGRAILQFQSFMFTAGERFMAPLIQEMRVHPTSVRPYFAALLGVHMGALTDGLKEAARGSGDEWLERWGDDEGFRDNLWGALLRSPMMVGPSGTLTDVALANFGRVANDRFEDLAGIRPLRQEATRFRESQGAMALAGPTFGMMFGTIPAMSRNFVEGDMDDFLNMLSRRIPVSNVFYLQALSQLAQEN